MSEIQRLRNIVVKLRAPDGCPWDREQTHHSLLRCLVEEVSEVLEAIDNEDDDSMQEELGDLLLQVVMHACMAEERESFDFEDVARGIADKLIRRHPHVFGEKMDKLSSSDEVIDRWEQIKAEEKKQKKGGENTSSIFKKLPPRLPALLFAADIYKRAVKKGFDFNGEWFEGNTERPDSQVDEKLIGSALFKIVAKCRKNGIDPEAALRKFASEQIEILQKEHFDK